MEIRLYMTCPTTEALGPFKRYALWVQGCNKRCKGCISPEAQPLDGGCIVGTDELATEILASSEIEGITISGGEPFLQQKALCELIDLIRAEKDLGVIVYTGMLYSEVKTTPLTQRCDLIIDGEYIEELNDDMSLRGSSNQQVICVSDKYRDIVATYYGCSGRKVEFVQKAATFNMIGIPSKSVATTLLRGENANV